VESADPDAGYGDRVAAEFARVRDALDELRRRPVPIDTDTLRRVIAASLAEAMAPPPNLLVTAIRRLDRLDARLESIEAALGAQVALPQGGTGKEPRRGKDKSASAPVTASPAVSYMPPPTDPEALAEALARRLTGVLQASPPTAVGGGGGAGGASMGDLVASARPLLADAARSVLRRAGREPSAQAVEVLEQTALSALEQVADALGPYVGTGSGAASSIGGRAVGPPTFDVEALAAALAAELARTLTSEPAARPIAEPGLPRSEPSEAVPPRVDPTAVADEVIRRLSQQPLPQAVVSPTAMAPLLSAVGNVEAAVARLSRPEADAVVAVDRLEAGVDALARALEDDRSTQAEELRRGFAELTELVRGVRPIPAWPDADGAEASPGEDARLAQAPAPLADARFVEVLPGLSAQGERLERSLGQVLTALAALAEHLHDQSTAQISPATRVTSPMDAEPEPHHPAEDAVSDPGIDTLARRIDELVAGTVADRQRFQRLGGTIDGLAELLGRVSERLNRLPSPPRTLTAAGSSPARHEPQTFDPGPPPAADPLRDPATPLDHGDSQSGPDASGGTHDQAAPALDNDHDHETREETAVEEEGPVGAAGDETGEDPPRRGQDQDEPAEPTEALVTTGPGRRRRGRRARRERSAD